MRHNWAPLLSIIRNIIIYIWAIWSERGGDCCIDYRKLAWKINPAGFTTILQGKQHWTRERFFSFAVTLPKEMKTTFFFSERFSEIFMCCALLPVTSMLFLCRFYYKNMFSRNQWGNVQKMFVIAMFNASLPHWYFLSLGSLLMVIFPGKEG